MNSLTATGALAAPMPAPVPAPAAVAPSSEDSSGSGDMLAAMRPAMDAAFAVGKPTNASGAAAILATTGDYVRGAQATMAKVGEGIERRKEQIAALQGTDPDRAAKLQEQVDLLEKLRDRIQLSIERVMGTTDSDDPDDDLQAQAKRKRRERDDELAVLARRHELLGSQVQSMLVQPADASMVAATYAGTGSGT
jgi:hypothetical protein